MTTDGQTTDGRARSVMRPMHCIDSVNGNGRRRLPGRITDLDLVRVWESDASSEQHGGESVFVLPQWYFIVDHASRRVYAIDPPVYRRLAAAAAEMLAERWRRTLTLRSGSGEPSGASASAMRRRSNRDVESTTTGVQLSHLLTPH